MLVRREAPVLGEPLKRPLLPHRRVVGDVVQRLRLQHKETAVDPCAVALRLLLERVHPRLRAAERQNAESARRLRRHQGGQRPLAAVEINEVADVDVADAVAIRHAEGAVFHIIGDPLEPPARHRLFARLHDSNGPAFDAVLQHFQPVVLQVEAAVAVTQEIIREVFLDDVALVPAAHNKLINAVGGVNLHDVPQNRSAADFNHRLRLDDGFFAQP